MRRASKRSKLQISAWYIGGGNMISVITGKPNQAFSKIKQIYNDEIINKTGNQESNSIDIKKLSLTEKEAIRKRVKQKMRRSILFENVKMIVYVLLIVTITLWLFFKE